MTETGGNSRHNTYTVAAGLFVRAFYKVYAEGNIVRPSVLALMYVLYIVCVRIVRKDSCSIDRRDWRAAQERAAVCILPPCTYAR